MAELSLMATFKNAYFTIAHKTSRSGIHKLNSVKPTNQQIICNSIVITHELTAIRHKGFQQTRLKLFAVNPTYLFSSKLAVDLHLLQKIP